MRLHSFVPTVHANILFTDESNVDAFRFMNRSNVQDNFVPLLKKLPILPMHYRTTPQPRIQKQCLSFNHRYPRSINLYVWLRPFVGNKLLKTQQSMINGINGWTLGIIQKRLNKRESSVHFEGNYEILQEKRIQISIQLMNCWKLGTIH